VESGSKNQKLLRHKELIGIQRLEYKKQKKNIGDGAAKSALVTQNFTQIQFEGSFVQDLIICIYTKDDGKNELDRVYRYFVGKSENKNDISFVVGI
jgi:hypothetical protein